MTQSSSVELLHQTVAIVSAFVSNNDIEADDLPDLIKTVNETVTDLAEGKSDAPKPAVPIEKSIHDDFLICLEDGRKLKMLKRYLRSRYEMTPDDYRARWGLSADYPMVAPNYAKLRSEHAKEIGLGRSAKSKKTNKLAKAE